MTQPINETTGETALAFEDLRAEISLLRRAVEGLAAAREHMPDYTPTLGSMMAQLKTKQEALHRIERSPADAHRTHQADRAGGQKRQGRRCPQARRSTRHHRAIDRADRWHH